MGSHSLMRSLIQLLEKIGGLWPLKWDIKYLLGDPTLSGRGFPKPGCPLGQCVSRPRQFPSLLNTYCRSLGYTTAQFPPTCSCISRAERRLSQKPSSGLLRAELGLVLVQCILWFQSKDWTTCAELLPRAFQVPLCKLISLPSAVEWTPVWWAVLLCWAMCPIPSPFTFPVLRNSPRAKSGLRAKASGGQRILKMQGSEEWQSFFCEAFTSYGSQPWLWQEWMEGGIQNTGQQIIPTLRSEATSHLYNQVLLTLEWKIFGMSAILYSLTPPPPPWDRSSMTLINRRIIKTLFSLPLYDAM